MNLALSNRQQSSCQEILDRTARERNPGQPESAPHLVRRRLLICLVAVLTALSLFCSADSAQAQGLLGRTSLSAQYLLFDAGENFDHLDTDLGHGGRFLGNLPLIEPDCCCSCLGLGFDVFGGFSGYRFQAFEPNLLQSKSDTVRLGADLGGCLYFQVTERIRPYGQAGANWNQTETKFSGPILGNFTTRVDDVDPILIGGVEYDILPCLALRGAYGLGADGFGNKAFLGEAIIRKHDCWFGRFSCSVDEDKAVLGGFGLGFVW